MKVTKLIQGVVVAVVVLCSVSVPRASAQALSNKWFKLKFSGKGFIIDPTTKDASKGSFSVPAFLQLLATSTNGVSYDYNLWTDTDAGWSNAFTSGATLNSTNKDAFFSDKSITVLGLGGNRVQGYHSPHIAIKTDKNGVFKSASYDGIGEIYSGVIIDGTVTNNFIGSFGLKGSTVDPAKLPFTAP